MEAPNHLSKVYEALGTDRIGLAAKLDVTDAAISQWSKTGIPPARALEIEQLTAGKVKASELQLTARKPRGPKPTPAPGQSEAA